jgi:hypothetical protein
MTGYRLDVLLRLRQEAADEALRKLGAAVAAVHAEERERERLHAEVDELRRRATGAPPGGGIGALRGAAFFQARLRSQAQALRQRMNLQESRLREAEATARRAGRALALARAEHEALVSHRGRWLSERRIAREAAEEREAEEWLHGRPGRNPIEQAVTGSRP